MTPLTRRSARPLRLLATLSLVVGVVAGASPALAAGTATPTRLHVHLSAASFKVGAPVLVTGSVTPKAAATVVLQRLVDKKWVSLARVHPSAAGTFTVTLTAPKKPAAWALRVVRAKSSSAKAGVSGVVKARVVAHAFSVTAATAPSVVSGQPVTVTGTVLPRASGTVVLQALSGKIWSTITSTKLSTSSTFTLSGLEPIGTYRLRVVKGATTITAAGLSRGISVSVVTPPVTLTPLSISTTTLPDATIGLSYSAQLTAVGGTPPYLWSAASGSLPAGLTLSAAGLLAGIPTSATTTSVTLLVSDAASGAARTTLSLRGALSPSAANAIRAWGTNTQGELGNGGTTSSATPVPAGLNGAIQIAGGGDAAYALRFDGTVWAWGNNTNGELGNGGVLPSSLPVRVPGLTGVTAIAAGSKNGYALEADGTVWAWGQGSGGALGNGSIMDSVTPVQVSGLAGVTSIASAYETAYAVLPDGTERAWGSNVLGQIGDGSSAVIQVTPVPVAGLTGVRTAAAGNLDGYAVMTDGTVRSWGYDGGNGALGNGLVTGGSGTPVVVSGLTNVRSVVGGSMFALALLNDGTVRGWGNNPDGELDAGALTSTDVPVILAGLSSVTAIAAGSLAGYALHTDGTISAWGNGAYDQLGYGGAGSTGTGLPVTVLGITNALDLAGGASAGYAILSS